MSLQGTCGCAAPRERLDYICEIRGDITLIVVAYRSHGDLEFLDRLGGHFGGRLLIDNGPEPHRPPSGTWEVVDSNGNVGFGPAANAGARRARTPLILFLNPDVRVDEATISHLAEHLDRDPSLVAVGPRLGRRNSVRDPNAGGAEKSLANALVFAFAPARALARRQMWLSAYPDTSFMETEWVSGACLLFRRDAFLDIGGFPPGHFLYEEDVALGREARRRGHRMGVAVRASVSHRVGGSQSADAYFRRWALGNLRTVRLVERTRRRRLLTLALICVGLLRRSTWRAFLGHPRPHRYLRWQVHYLMAFGDRPPPDGPELPRGRARG